MFIGAKHLTNWRAKLIYDPRVLALQDMGWRTPLWGSDEQAHQRIEQWIEWLRAVYEEDEPLYDISGMEPALGGADHGVEPTLAGSSLQNYLSRLLQDDPNPKIRAKAIGMLGKIGDVEAVPLLIAVMQSDDTQYIRHECSRVLRKLGTPEALAAVEVWLQEGNRQVNNGT